MKLLGWMHRKLRDNTVEPIKESSLGSSCTCFLQQSSAKDEEYNPKPSYGYQSLGHPHKKHQQYFSAQEKNRFEEPFQEESTTELSELFHGFLAIGTLGVEPMIAEPATPTFALSFDDMIEKETEVSEKDLKLLNNELERFLEAEAKDNDCDEQLGRNSFVMISNKKTGAETEEHEEMAACPLQGYLFGSSVELAETRTEAVKERVSLRELFQQTQIEDKHCKTKCGGRKTGTKGTYKSTVHTMKKILKSLHASTKSSISSSIDDTTENVLAKKRLHKVLKVFRRKIHPEPSMVAKESNKYEMEKIPCGYCREKNQTLVDERKNTSLQGVVSKEGIGNKKTNINMPQNGLCHSGSCGSREHWITTDADYLVLEL